MNTACSWSSDGCWETSCGESFTINDEMTPMECGMCFCCFCGLPLVQLEEA
jgi:hypothetical protein